MQKFLQAYLDYTSFTKYLKTTPASQYSSGLRLCSYILIKDQKVPFDDHKRFTTMNCFAQRHPDMFPAMTNCKAVLHASIDRFFRTTKKNAHDDIPTSAWQAALNEEHSPTTTELGATFHYEALVDSESLYMEAHVNENEDMIALEVKSIVKGLVTTAFSAIVE